MPWYTSLHPGGKHRHTSIIHTRQHPHGLLDRPQHLSAMIVESGVLSHQDMYSILPLDHQGRRDVLGLSLVGDKLGQSVKEHPPYPGVHAGRLVIELLHARGVSPLDRLNDLAIRCLSQLTSSGVEPGSGQIEPNKTGFLGGTSTCLAWSKFSDFQIETAGMVKNWYKTS